MPLMAATQQPALPQRAAADAGAALAFEQGRVALDQSQVSLQDRVEEEGVGIVGAEVVERHQVIRGQVPPALAQEVAEALIASGIRGLLNFAPCVLRVPARVPVVSVDLAVQLEQLAFLLRLPAER